MWKRILGFVVLAAAAAGVVAFFFLRQPDGAPDEAYRAEVVETGDVTMTVTATGTISAVTTVQVGSQVSGIIARIHADFNSPVRRGQMLAELDPTPFEAMVSQRQADLLQAQVQMRRAHVDFERQERLLRDGLAPQADHDAAKANLDSASAQVEQASAALRQAETNLKYTRISCPIDGVVVARQYDVGQTVAASFQAPTLFTIAQDLTKMQVQADVDQSDIGRIRAGQVARFTVDAYPEQDFRGEIAQIRLNATVNQNVITYPVILRVPNPEEKLRPQMTANVTIEVATVKDVLRVPNAALRFRPTRPQAGEAAAPRGREGTGRQGGQPPDQRGRPEERVSGREGSEPMGPWGEKRRGGLGAMAGILDAATRPSETNPRTQAIYLLDPSGGLRRVPVRTGISDGKHTQIVDGEVLPGARVVVGAATARGDAAQRPPGSMGRMF